MYSARFAGFLAAGALGAMVKRKKTWPTPEEQENGMTPGSREDFAVDGRTHPSRRAEEESEDGGTKGDEASAKLSPASKSPPGPAPARPAPALAESSTPSHDQHHFLRSSVRPPSKRIRKDSVGSAINGHGGAKAKGAENGSSSQGVLGQSGPVAGSTGVSKTAKGQGSVEKEEQVGNQKRARRQWESWSAEDKNSFFEGLYEHGKDFEAIQNNIAMKYRKRGKPANMVKNKEQVRHFYYRTWHKISKHIDFANVYTRVLKKSSQELYGLICYAELRKKVGGLMDDKNVAKLNELIQQGATTVRSKGRNLRIKAPMCRALKKLCDPDGVSDEEDQKPVRLPLKVAVELQPRSNYSWARVHSLAYNPRLRMVVELHRKVSSLIEFLKQKWACHDQRIMKSLLEREALGEDAPPPDELFLFPAESSTLTTLPGVSRVVHSKASCTVHWQESGKTRPNAKELPAAQILGIHTAAPRTGAKSARGTPGSVSVTPQSDCRKTEPPGIETWPEGSVKAEEKKPSTLSPSQQAAIPAEEATGLFEEAGGGLAGTKTVDNLCSGAESCLDQCREEQVSSGQTPPAKLSMGGPEDAKERSVQQIREDGWNLRDAENVTLAELYLMFGKPGKLQLEYEWQSPAHLHQDGGAVSSQPRLRGKQRVLSCLLRLLTSEINPKPLAPELCSTAPGPQDEHSPTGKGSTAGVRSPNCGRLQASVRGGRLHQPNTSGARHLPRSLLCSSAAASDSEGNVFAVPTTLPPNSSRHNRMFSPNKEAELALRQQLDSISMQSDLFLSRPRKPRNRQLRKPLVVQRTLLPRTTGDTPQHVCSFSILSNSSATGTGSFRPIQTRLAPPTSRPPPSIASSPAGTSQLSSAIDLAAKTAGIIPASPCRGPHSPTSTPASPCRGPHSPTPAPASPCRGPHSPTPASPCRGPHSPTPASPCRGPHSPMLPSAQLLDAEQHLQHHLPEKDVPPASPGVKEGGDSLLAPPSVASLLDISLPGPPEESLPPGENPSHISDSIIELAINSAHYGEEAKMTKVSPSVSPSRGWIPSPGHDPQWYPTDSSDSTLGCLLSSMGRRTPRTLFTPSLLDCNSHDSFHSRGLPDVGEVDSQLACMMSESSVDYIARFNDLAQELAVSEPSITPQELAVSEPSMVPQELAVSEPSVAPQELAVSEPSVAPQELAVSEPSVAPQELAVSEPSVAPQELAVSEPSLVPQELAVSEPSLVPQELAVSEPSMAPQELAFNEPSMAPQELAVSEPSMAPQELAVSKLSMAPQELVVSEPSLAPQELVVSDPSMAPQELVVSEPSMAPQELVVSEPSLAPQELVVSEPSMAPQELVVSELSMVPQELAISQPSMAPQELVVSEPSMAPQELAVSEPSMAPQELVVSEPSMAPQELAVSEPSMAPQELAVSEPSMAPQELAVSEPSMAPQELAVSELSMAPQELVVSEPSMAPQELVVSEPSMAPQELAVSEPSRAPQELAVSEPSMAPP
ncbi:protein cramped-like isoform X2 [Nerophis ophidion]|uniref:protein cramped-like isoform X2 n=1 Tax=Nerophis ophidion TaxID=159077 RepID=UPI002AE04DFE|nr:protein cramped-like isoform X2 [Nerophis ophidion]